MKVVALAGGVGGAKLVDGLARALLAEDLAVIVNTGDDFEHLGLNICPDLDTVCYTLAGIANETTGWGRAGETWSAMESLAELGGPDWFRLGDRDLGTHLERTRRLREGHPLSQITRSFCQAWGVRPSIYPMSDDPVPTVVSTEEGELPFQEYFVRRRCQPRVKGFRFQGAERAAPAPRVLEALQAAQLVVICPSNPWVSVDPILAVPGVRDLVIARTVVAVSPLIGGRAVKGPAAKMFAELGLAPSALTVAHHYGAQSGGGLLTGFILDGVDEDQRDPIVELGVQALVADTLMKTPSDRLRLAEKALNFGEQLLLQKERNR
jgi:LPPG:FO 2-phospho-L-lactate transferase